MPHKATRRGGGSAEAGFLFGPAPEGLAAAPALTGQLSLQEEAPPTGPAELRPVQHNHPHQLIEHNTTLNPTAPVPV